MHQVRKNIFHLMRGQIFTIEDKTFLTMGGAYSIDKYMRREGYSWWPEELPSDEEYKEAAKTIEAHEWKVDYVISHTAPREIIGRMCRCPDEHDIELTGFLEWIMYEADYKKWFFGHWHLDAEIDSKFRALWFDVVSV